MRDGWVVAAVLVVFMLGLLFGALVMQAGIRIDCKELGTFRADGEVFECSPVGKDGEVK